MAKNSDELIKELRLASYVLASRGRWIERNGLLLPKNICSDSADIIEWMVTYIAQLEHAVEDLSEHN